MVAANNPNSKDLIAFREVIQLFIDGKMNSYNKIKVTCDVMEESTTIETGKYRASLFMLHKMLRTMEINELAEKLELPFDLLNEWRSEKAFTTLVYSNYKEFLIYLGELYT
jgi:hypothetical protein